jgi:hypothetical protein
MVYSTVQYRLLGAFGMLTLNLILSFEFGVDAVV